MHVGKTIALPVFTIAQTIWGKSTRPLLVDISPKLSPVEIKEIQCVISSILYYACMVDITILMALSSIAIEQTKGNTNTMAKAKQLLDYLQPTWAGPSVSVPPT